MRKYITESEIGDEDLSGMIVRAYQSFRSPNCVELRPLPTDLTSSIYLLELFHGPTFAFKDFALQLLGESYLHCFMISCYSTYPGSFLGQLFDYILKSTGRRMAILGATSGDTGSAAIAGEN